MTLATPFHRTAITDHDAAILARTLRILGDPARLQILGILYRQPGLTGVGIGQALGRLSQPTVSHHLTLLKAAGLVEEARDGRVKLFRLKSAGVAAVREALAL